MNRYYSDSDDGYSKNQRPSTEWQSSSPTTRLVVDSPFGSNKFDYSIDKSQRGRLIVTARRPRSRSLNHRSSREKSHVAVQTFSIPLDADVDRLQSYIDRTSNRLIIEIPRRQQQQQQQQQQASHRVISRPSRTSYVDSSRMARNFIRSPDVERMLTSPTGGPQLIRESRPVGKRVSGSNRKLEYRIDCHGYAADELDVFLQGRDLMVQGQTRTSSDPNTHRVSKKFTRKISLPNTVDLEHVISYLDHGELRVEAPLKPGVRYDENEIVIPGPPPTSTSNRATAALVSNYDRRMRSPPPPSSNRYYHQSIGRRRDYDRGERRRVTSPTRRGRSSDATRYPMYISPRAIDDDAEEEDTEPRNSRRRHNGSSEQRFVFRKDFQAKPSYRSLYSPTNHHHHQHQHHTTTSTISGQQNYNSYDDGFFCLIFLYNHRNVRMCNFK
jgi:HSP20 family molecular chaperone IbpA